MLGVLLLIAKIIGIILLCIIGLAVLVISVILFVPVRYTAELSAAEKQVNGKIGIHWLLHFVQLRIVLENSSRTVSLRLAGIRLKKKDKAQVAKGGRKNTAKKKNTQYPDEEDTVKMDAVEENPAEDNDRNPDARLLDLIARPETDARTDFESAPETESAEQDEADIPGFFAKLSLRLSGLLKKPGSFLKKGRETASRVTQKRDWIRSLLEELQSDTMSPSVDRLKMNLLKLLIHIFPQKGTLTLRIGFENPATTGQVLGILAMLYPRFSGRLSVTPYFDRKILEGCISCRGRIRIFTLLIIALKTGLDKNIRSFVKKVRNGGN